ncbi:uncharacterized protein [Solanum lycopersicum]|uniref:uncharacterized protein n=1 Tax=Solanum lycopersicum TaxID=4081 RepID=UPI003748A939
MYFPRESREVKVEEIINLKQGNMSVEEYSLKFSTFSKYVPPLVSYLRDEMSRFMIGVANLVREECHTAVLHDDMTLARLMVYDQSIEESKHGRIAKNLKRSGLSDQGQPRSKKRAQSQEDPRSGKVKFEKEVVLKMENLHVLIVEKVIIRNVYWVLGVVLDVVNMDTR